MFEQGLTVHGRPALRSLSFICGAGMATASILTVRHFFMANYPASIFEGSFCDLSAFFNCDSSAYSAISQIAGVPLGYFGLVVGLLVMLGALFPSVPFERTNKSISLANALGVVVLFCYSVFYLGSLCLLCSGFYLFSLVSFYLFWRHGIDNDRREWRERWMAPSLLHVLVCLLVTLGGAYAMFLYHEARKEAQSGGVTARIVQQYYGLETVKPPSLISPFWTAKATEDFTGAPIQVIEYADFLCPDCRLLHEQLLKLKQEFKGRINIAFQFFPLDAQCNQVVDKNKHPGACDLSYLAAFDAQKFLELHDEIFANMDVAKKPEWRAEFARKHGLEAALQDEKTKDLVNRIIQTGAEYDKTSDQYAHGIRSTPTMIVNNRMIIGTLPYPQLRAIFQSLAEPRQEEGKKGFYENWVPTK